jgi:hypothetical protein
MLRIRRGGGSFVWQVLRAAGIFCAEEARDAEIAEKEATEIRAHRDSGARPEAVSSLLGDLCVSGFFCAK